MVFIIVGLGFIHAGRTQMAPTSAFNQNVLPKVISPRQTHTGADIDPGHTHRGLAASVNCQGVSEDLFPYMKSYNASLTPLRRTLGINYSGSCKPSFLRFL